MMKSNKAYKFRLYPNKKQAKQLDNNLGSCRFVFNYFLTLSKETYEKEKRCLRYKDYAMKKDDFMNGELVPRLLRTEIGDIYTTNTFGANTSNASTVAGLNLAVGEIVTPSTATGYLVKGSTATEGMKWQVVKEYTMPDGQPGVKLQRIG